MEKIKNGIYYIDNCGGWYICKIKNYWYLLSSREYNNNKDNLENFIDSVMINKYYTKKQLINKYKREALYNVIFKGVGV